MNHVLYFLMWNFFFLMLYCVYTYWATIQSLAALPLGSARCTDSRSALGSSSTSDALSFLMVDVVCRMEHVTIMSGQVQPSAYLGIECSSSAG